MNIVVGYVPDERGNAAFGAALEIAKSFGHGLQVLNSSDRHARVDPQLASAADLDALTRAADEAGVSCEILQRVETDGVDALLELSESPATKMIVIGLRHRSRVGKLLMGSSAQQVLLEAHCPVLAVKAP